jgi:hypothetical protein
LAQLFNTAIYFGAPDEVLCIAVALR